MSDSDLLARMPGLVLAERAAVADVVVHLMEIDRRRLYLEQACSSLYRFAIERLGYSEDEALKRVRVVRLAERLPRVLEALRSGAVHLTGLFLLSSHLTEQNADELLAAVRGKSRREIEQLLTRWAPRPAMDARIEPLRQDAGAETEQFSLSAGAEASGPRASSACPGPGERTTRTEFEGATARYRVEFTASAEFRAKLEQARELVSHALPLGELQAVLERALDALIERELRRRTGAGRPRKRRVLKDGSRHVPLDVARIVWERDGGQCTFEDVEGRRVHADAENQVATTLLESPQIDNRIPVRAHPLRDRRLPGLFRQSGQRRAVFLHVALDGVGGFERHRGDIGKGSVETKVPLNERLDDLPKGCPPHQRNWVGALEILDRWTQGAGIVVVHRAMRLQF